MLRRLGLIQQFGKVFRVGPVKYDAREEQWRVLETASYMKQAFLGRAKESKVARTQDIVPRGIIRVMGHLDFAELEDHRRSNVRASETVKKDNLLHFAVCPSKPDAPHCNMWRMGRSIAWHRNSVLQRIVHHRRHGVRSTRNWEKGIAPRKWVFKGVAVGFKPRGRDRTTAERKKASRLHFGHHTILFTQHVAHFVHCALLTPHHTV